MAKIHLPRYRLQNLSRRELEEEAWLGTHHDFRSSGPGPRTVIWQNALVPLTELPLEELRERAASSLRKTLMQRAHAHDLSLYEQNPDKPDTSILFAGSEILFRTRAGWNLAYVQPSHFDEHELVKASKYAQVVGHLYKDETAEFVVRKLRETSSYSDWRKLEKSGAVVRDAEGNVTIRNHLPT